MRYPSLEQVEYADIEQLARWFRFLESPGMSAIEYSVEEFNKASEKEMIIFKRISERFKDLGGFTPELSKKIGWLK